MNSTHKVEVVPVQLLPHPNADSLSIVQVFGYQVCVRTADWEGKTLGAFIPPDSIVPDTPEYAFLGGKLRIKAKRLRGVKSFGLLVPAPEGSVLWENVAEKLGITHYDPPEPLSMGGDAEKPPVYEDENGFRSTYPVYDVESLRRYPDVLKAGELVSVTEKIHGCNARFLYLNERLYAGSHTTWKAVDPNSLWWKVLNRETGLQAYLSEHPGICVYGEIYGQVQDLKYQGGLNLAVFDAYNPRTGQWFVPDDSRLTRVPELYNGPFDLETVLGLAEGRSAVVGASNVREGVVVRPLRDRWENGERVIYKAVGVGYLERA